MCDCDRALELISLDLDGDLAPQECQELEAHLSSCPSCAALAQELSALHEALPGLEEEVPEGFHQAVMERVRREKVQPLPVRKTSGLAWRRWISLAAVFAVVLIGAGNLGKSWTGSTSGSPETAAGDAAQAPREAVVSQGEPAGESQGPEVDFYAAQEETSSAATARDGVEKEAMNVEPEDVSESPLPTVGPALMEAHSSDATLTEEQQAALSANGSAWLQTSGLDQAEAIDTTLLSVETVTQEVLESAVCPDETLRPLLGLEDFLVILGDPSGPSHALLLCDSATLEVLGYLPAV